MKTFFRLPELLLVIALMAWPFIAAKTTFDIQTHNPYVTVSRHPSWRLILFVIPVGMALTLTWVMHLLSRKYEMLPPVWRWVQVGLTITSLAMAIGLRLLGLVFQAGRYVLIIDEPFMRKFMFWGAVSNWILLVFVLVQVIFWIAVVALAVRRRRGKVLSDNKP